VALPAVPFPRRERRAFYLGNEMTKKLDGYRPCHHIGPTMTRLYFDQMFFLLEKAQKALNDEFIYFDLQDEIAKLLKMINEE
jgi:hypothetical protein